MPRTSRVPPAVLAVLALASLSSPVRAQGAPAPETVAEGLEFPTGIAFGSGGRMFVNERAGRVRVVDRGRLEDEPVAEIPTTTTGETGLLGVAVSPDDRFLYVFVTAPDGATNGVMRVPVGGGEPEPVLEGLPASVYHNGGGVAFDDDGMLLVSNGEQHDGDRAQDPDALGGKVYRFTPDGGVPDDNPFGGSPALAIGLRNPYGLTVDPVSGTAFVTENGPSAHDEIDRIVPGGNYGWPIVSGRAADSGLAEEAQELQGSYRDPLIDLPEIVVPTGIAFADPATAPGSIAGDLFFATYGEGTIHRVRLNDERDEVVSDEIFVDAGEPVIALAWGPRGLYFSTPDAVKVLPLAASEASGDESPSPDEGSDRGEPVAPADRTPEDGGSGGNVPVVLVAGAALLGACVWGALRLRRAFGGG
ncbi:hypothetical protein BH24ACT26_BH24ACT26_03470 [soil metagenome]